jgi:alginate O-acetyltransferase complex protein AlgI
MLFNSISYLIFLPFVTLVLFLIPKKLQWLWLLVCSTFFYYLLLPLYLVVLLALIPLNYFFGLHIESAGINKQRVFNIALLGNLVVLAFFKYYGFLDSIFATIISHSGSDTFWRIILPIGLSYFIFNILSYLIEIKRGTITAERNIGIFASSLMFFPKLLQGPIERPSKIILQFREEKGFDYGSVVEGLKMMLWGYFKKLVIADRLAIYVNAVYGNAEMHNGTSLAVATFFYAFQIYADFSGYTDIALGSAKIMGFELTNNFNRPYFATSIKEFWNRWHISFSTWLRDYLFLPLAYYFSKKMKNERYLGIATEKWIFLFSALITFAICGLWHGEGFNFLAWGLLFGIYLSYANWTSGINKNIRKTLHISKKSKFYIGYKIILTFLLVLFTFIFFRAPSLTIAFEITRKIFTSYGAPFYASPGNIIYAVFGILVLTVVDFKREFFNNKISLLYHKYSAIRIGTIVAMVMIILVCGVFDGGQFIYFQF